MQADGSIGSIFLAGDMDTEFKKTHAQLDTIQFDVIQPTGRLLAKKRHFKQATMQQLLTGKKRLPGFEGEWESRRLLEFGTFLKGSGVKKDDSMSGQLPCIRYGEIYTTHDDCNREFRSYISREFAEMATNLLKGDLLFAGSGETRDELGKCVAFVDDARQ